MLQLGTTGQYPLGGLRGCYLTVKSSARRYLSKNVDPREQLLVLLWGTYGSDPEPHWLVNVTSRSALPPEAEFHGKSGTLVGFDFLVVQREHTGKLDGKTMSYQAGSLVVK